MPIEKNLTPETGSNFNHRGDKVKKRGSLGKFKIFTNRKLQFTAGDNFIFNPVAWPLKSDLDPRFFTALSQKLWMWWNVITIKFWRNKNKEKNTCPLRKNKNNKKSASIMKIKKNSLVNKKYFEKLRNLIFYHKKNFITFHK
jgi:hypothetical protein